MPLRGVVARRHLGGQDRSHRLRAQRVAAFSNMDSSCRHAELNSRWSREWCVRLASSSSGRKRTLPSKKRRGDRGDGRCGTAAATWLWRCRHSLDRGDSEPWGNAQQGPGSAQRRGLHHVEEVRGLEVVRDAALDDLAPALADRQQDRVVEPLRAGGQGGLILVRFRNRCIDCTNLNSGFCFKSLHAQTGLFII